MAKLKRKHKIFLITICVTIIIMIALKMGIYRPHLLMFQNLGLLKQRTDVYKLACPNVLERMVVGYWVTNDFNQDEIDEVENFHRKVRKFHGIPQSLQRKDGRCGNVHFDMDTISAGLKYFRALCDPDDASPCCLQHKCVPKPMDMCSCEHCYDVRQQIHAELSTWIPTDPNCQITRFVGERDTCRLISGMTFYFVGDSFMKELFVAVLDLIRSKDPHGSLNKNAPPKKLQLCDRFYRLTVECKSFIANDVRECGNTTRLRLITYWKASDTSKVLSLIGDLQGKPNTFVILGAGIHEDFNLNVVENEIVEPLFEHLSKSPWPKPIWLSTHSPGLLKAPRFTNQQTRDVVAFNAKIKAVLRSRGVPILDFFQLTKGVMSYDGTHYGAGVNDVKAQVFLNYILETKLNMTML